MLTAYLIHMHFTKMGSFFVFFVVVVVLFCFFFGWKF